MNFNLKVNTMIETFLFNEDELKFLTNFFNNILTDDIIKPCDISLNIEVSKTNNLSHIIIESPKKTE